MMYHRVLSIARSSMNGIISILKEILFIMNDMVIYYKHVFVKGILHGSCAIHTSMPYYGTCN